MHMRAACIPCLKDAGRVSPEQFLLRSDNVLFIICAILLFGAPPRIRSPQPLTESTMFAPLPTLELPSSRLPGVRRAFDGWLQARTGARLNGAPPGAPMS